MSLQDYEVKSETLTFDEVDFVKGDVISLDSDVQEFSELLADGKIVPIIEEEEEELPLSEGTHQPEV